MNMDENGLFECILCLEKIDGFSKLQKHFNRKHNNNKLQGFKNKDEAYSIKEGHEDMFHNYGAQFKKNKAEPLMEGLGFKMQRVKRSGSYNKYYYPVISNNQILEAANSISQRDLYETVVTEVEKIEASPRRFTAEDDILNSNYLKLMKKYGPYIKVDANLLDSLDNEKNLEKIVNTFPGRILSSKHFILLIISVEIFSRSRFDDPHLEKTGLSFPESTEKENRRYNNINICLINEGDLKNGIKKLAFGFANFNLLITGSLLVYPVEHGGVKFDPKVHPFLEKSHIRLNQCSLLLQKERIDIFNKNVPLNDIGIFGCRQLTSQFTHHSTYQHYRGNLFETNVRQPATVFTLNRLCDSGFGFTSANTCNQVSLFLQFIHDCVHDPQNLKEVDALFSKESGDKRLDALIKALKQEYHSNPNIELLDFLNNKGVSTIAQSISSSVSTTNRTLEKITDEYIYDKCK